MNAYKNFKARTAAGTSWQFILLITLGYFAGIAAKFVSGTINWVLAVYFHQRRLHRRQLGRVLPQLAPSTASAIDCAKRRTRRTPWRKRVPRANGRRRPRPRGRFKHSLRSRGRWPISIYMQLASESRLARGFPRIPANRHPDSPTC